MRATTGNPLTRLLSSLPDGVASNRRAAPVTASRKKRKKGVKTKQATLRCQQQVAPCEARLTAQCAGDQACIAAQVPCCSRLATCDFTAFLACF